MFVSSKIECDSSYGVYYGVYEKKEQVELSAVCGLCQTFGVCIILFFGAWKFSSITSELVIDPIEKMIERVNLITSDPLSAVHEEEERLLINAIRDGGFGGEEDFISDLEDEVEE